MNWSLSEFLNLIELRSQSWCFINLGPSSGIRLPHSETIFFHAVLEGTVKIAGLSGGVVELKAGDIAIILSGDTHAIRNHEKSSTAMVDLLTTGAYVDSPPTITLGEGRTESRLLCGRLKVRWPGGQHLAGVPPLLRIHATDTLVNFDKLVDAAKGAGASALLTHLATLLFVSAFRINNRCQALFRYNLHDPIARAHTLIEKHPFQPWTVESLASKVGMGRSNFAARFAAQIGKTPIDVLTEERIKLAADLLEKTGLKVAEIGERVGYRSEAAFSRRFTNYFGMTPGQLRKQRRQAH